MQHWCLVWRGTSFAHEETNNKIAKIVQKKKVKAAGLFRFVPLESHPYHVQTHWTSKVQFVPTVLVLARFASARMVTHARVRNVHTDVQVTLLKHEQLRKLSDQLHVLLIT